MGSGFSLFETAIGRCGIAWGPRGVVGIQLPEATVGATRGRLRQRFPEAAERDPPATVRRAQRAIAGLLSGDATNLASIEIDLSGVPDFRRRVYEAAREIPPGETSTYGELAARMGSPDAARAVGQALGRNPFAIVVPCHRVLGAGGRIGGFSAEGGVVTKRRLLELEGAALDGKRARPQKVRDAPSRLAFDADAAIGELRASDRRLARIIDSIGPFELERELRDTHSVFGALAEAIVYQQLSGKAAATIWGRLCASFPRATHGPSARQIVAASDESLRGVGLSRAKVLALRDLAERTLARDVPSLRAIHRLSDDEVIERLTRVRGVGRWTAEMFLIFRLGRPDVLPVDDLGVRKGFAVAFRRAELPTPRELAAHGGRWAPWRTVVSWYLWRVADRAGDASLLRAPRLG